MSIDENPNEPTTQAEEPKQPEVKPAEPVVNAAAPATNAVGDVVATLLALKESNPKAFFGGAGAIVLVLLYLVAGGNSDHKLPTHQFKPVVAGQNYVLKSPNAYDPQATVRLVSVPGSMAAYDDTEEADRDGPCKHMPQNTPVKVVQSQDAYGKKDVYAEVEMTSGECEGKRGWTLSVNLQ